MINIKEYLWEKYKCCNKELVEINEKYEHSLKVFEIASILNVKHDLNIDFEKLEIACLLHDYAKFVDFDVYKEIVLKHKLDVDILNYPKVLHALLAPYIIKEELQIFDEEVLDAIMYHSTGKANMSKFESLVYLADYIETNRTGHFHAQVRDIAMQDINKAVAMELKFTVEYLKEQKKEVMPLTMSAYEWYKKYL